MKYRERALDDLSRRRSKRLNHRLRVVNWWHNLSQRDLERSRAAAVERDRSARAARLEVAATSLSRARGMAELDESAAFPIPPLKTGGRGRGSA